MDYQRINDFLRVEANKLIKHKINISTCAWCGIRFKPHKTDQVYCKNCAARFIREEYLKKKAAL
jgi:DNA-directed RNA polymerase subunit RPC12/RpoP